MEFWRHILSGCQVCDWGIQYHLCGKYCWFPLPLNIRLFHRSAFVVWYMGVIKLTNRKPAILQPHAFQHWLLRAAEFLPPRKKRVGKYGYLHGPNYFTVNEGLGNKLIFPHSLAYLPNYDATRDTYTWIPLPTVAPQRVFSSSERREIRAEQVGVCSKY